MQYIPFGKTGMETSRLLLGAMTFPNTLDLDGSRRVVDEALDHGVNFIDTADSYGDCEEVLGRVLSKEKRERIFLATKVYRQFCRDRRAGRNSRTNLLNALERSLRLLRTDYVDLYQLHHPDDRTPLDETLQTLDTMVRQGKARYVGVSNHYAWQMAWMLTAARERGLAPIVSYQADYSLLYRQVEREAVPFCRRFDIAIMCYGPLAGGILTGKYHGPRGIPEGSRASKSEQMRAEIADETVKRVVEALRRVAAENDLKMNQAAVLWLMSKPHATGVILGGSRPEHFREIYEVADRSLPQEAVQALDEASAPRVYLPFRNQPIRSGPRVG